MRQQRPYHRCLNAACVNSKLLTESNWLCFDGSANAPNAVAQSLPGFDVAQAAKERPQTNYPPDGSENDGDGDIQPRARGFRPILNTAFAMVTGGLLGVVVKSRYFMKAQRPAGQEIYLPAVALSEMVQAMDNLNRESQSSVQGSVVTVFCMWPQNTYISSIQQMIYVSGNCSIEPCDSLLACALVHCY